MFHRGRVEEAGYPDTVASEISILALIIDNIIALTYFTPTDIIGVPISTLKFVISPRSQWVNELLPVAKAPPWRKTITGMPLAPSSLGTEMLSVRHSVSD